MTFELTILPLFIIQNEDRPLEHFYLKVYLIMLNSFSFQMYNKV